jgi:hypothetical protein
MFTEKFDYSFDVGCFHCLNEEGQRKYVSEICRLLKSGATYLIWGLNNSPSGIQLTPEYIAKLFGDYFQLAKTNLAEEE